MPFDINSKLKDILATPEGKAIFEKYLPGSTTNPQMKQAYGMSLKVMASFPQSKELKEKLPAMLEELAKIP